jgi:hypothetical protein
MSLAQRERHATPEQSSTAGVGSIIAAAMVLAPLNSLDDGHATRY